MKAGTKYLTEFYEDIDNFLGVQKIENYCILALKEDGYQFGEKSAGVMMLFNKSCKTDIYKSDLIRLEHLSRLIGGMSKKAKEVTTILTMMITLEVNKHKVHSLVNSLDNSHANSPFQYISLCIETVKKFIN